MATPRLAKPRTPHAPIAAVAAVVAALTVAPAASATYPGVNGPIAYPDSINNPDTGEATQTEISSIPGKSAVNCPGTKSDGSTSCDIGRFGYSPDGKQIVAARSQTGAAPSGQLAVLDRNGGNVRILSPLTSDDEQPAFLPGGHKIVFAGNANHRTNLYEVATDGTGLKQLTMTGGSWPAPCSNRTIAFINSGALYLINIDGSHLRRLVRRNVSTPDCAPNSRSIVYQGLNSDFIVQTKGGSPQRVPGGDTPVFSPDGKRTASVEDLPDPESGGSPVQTIVVFERESGRRVRKQAVGDNLGVYTIGALTWVPR